jgi:PIN domain nuclease of toxin-antitoxin system
MYLSERNRIPLDLIEFIRKIKISDNYKIIDLDAEIVIVAGNLNGLELHDRLIVATAKYLNVPILTSDQMIRNSGFIKVIWD